MGNVEKLNFRAIVVWSCTCNLGSLQPALLKRSAFRVALLRSLWVWCSWKQMEKERLPWLILFSVAIAHGAPLVCVVSYSATHASVFVRILISLYFVRPTQRTRLLGLKWEQGKKDLHWRKLIWQTKIKRGGGETEEAKGGRGRGGEKKKEKAGEGERGAEEDKRGGKTDRQAIHTTNPVWCLVLLCFLAVFSLCD